MKKSESITEINKGLVEFRKKVKQPMKDKNNPFYKSKYVPLENVVEAIDEVASSVGLSFTQWALNDSNGGVGVATMLLHESGEYIEYDAVFMKPEKQTPQGAGSTITYLKRYALSAIFGITSDEDDDGNQASNAGGKQQNKQQNNQRQSYNQPKMNENNKQLPMQDKGKVELVKQNAKDLADILNAQDDADKNNPTTQDSILKAYLKGRALKDVSNEDLIHLSKSIKNKIQQYSSK